MDVRLRQRRRASGGKQVIYRECLDKVCGVLEQNGIAPEVMDRVRAISPDK